MGLQALYDAAMKGKQDLEDDAEACRHKMANATALIEGLGGEKVGPSPVHHPATPLASRVTLLFPLLVSAGPLDQQQRRLPDSDGTAGGGRPAVRWLPVLRRSLQPGVPQPAAGAVEEGDGGEIHPLQLSKTQTLCTGLANPPEKKPASTPE